MITRIGNSLRFSEAICPVCGRPYELALLPAHQAREAEAAMEKRRVA